MPPRRRSKPRSPSHRALGEAVEELREEASLTHEELAERLEMSFQRISELERGVANPTFITLMRVADGLEVELSELVLRFERRRDAASSAATP
ncbi:MAG TPA: helix-turn-helix transcriptional regulator [Solirubrobacterales bacterium]|nr:helix-turn-helix transcriptional regulator [Solirubrobacterales bacterium]